MGYLKEFRESFSKRLTSLDPEAMQKALDVACKAVLESYRNGQQSARDGGKESHATRGEKRPSARKGA